MQDPEWDDLDIAIVATYTDYINNLCDCGHPLDESLYDETNKNPVKYEPEFFVCNACYQRELFQYRMSLKDEGQELDKAKPFIPNAARKYRVRKAS